MLDTMTEVDSAFLVADLESPHVAYETMYNMASITFLPPKRSDVDIV